MSLFSKSHLDISMQKRSQHFAILRTQYCTQTARSRYYKKHVLKNWANIRLQIKKQLVRQKRDNLISLIQTFSSITYTLRSKDKYLPKDWSWSDLSRDLWIFIIWLAEFLTLTLTHISIINNKHLYIWNVILVI